MNLFQVFSTSGESAGNNRRLHYCPQCGASFIRKELGKFERQSCNKCGFIHY
ncbi:zinc ribbon domain-containing protein [uncultured Desulfobulbus sp.]|uniref:zinc ribbon domain-containing protein n=1 Tax=uncultured Desulfobulbus sp. TaxID=239745 RepID=UPI00374CC5E9